MEPNKKAATTLNKSKTSSMLLDSHNATKLSGKSPSSGLAHKSSKNLETTNRGNFKPDSEQSSSYFLLTSSVIQKIT